MGTVGDEHIDIAEYRISVDVDLGGSALGLRQVDGDVTQDCDGDQLILDIPGSRALAAPASFKDRVQGVVALFTLTAGLERARRQKKDAGALSLLQVIAARDGIRPSDIADLQLVHPSRSAGRSGIWRTRVTCGSPGILLTAGRGWWRSRQQGGTRCAASSKSAWNGSPCS
jgi:hypothetical protein